MAATSKWGPPTALIKEPLREAAAALVKPQLASGLEAESSGASTTPSRAPAGGGRSYDTRLGISGFQGGACLGGPVLYPLWHATLALHPGCAVPDRSVSGEPYGKLH